MADMNRTEGPAAIDGDRIAAIKQAIEDINLGAVATCGLAIDSLGARTAGTYITAIENIAKVTCRKCDLIFELLGESIKFGNFSEDFNVKDALAAASRARQGEQQ
jgi:hypothetical protein